MASALNQALKKRTPPEDILPLLTLTGFRREPGSGFTPFHILVRTAYSEGNMKKILRMLN
jgi:hypothetical protein